MISTRDIDQPKNPNAARLVLEGGTLRDLHDMLCHASLNIKATIDQRSKRPSRDLRVLDPTKFLSLERY